MEAEFFARGLAVGFSIAAPVGAIGLLCVRRTLAEGRLAGFVTGLGAATADAAYGAVAAFGLTAVMGALTDHAAWVRLLGGCFLCYLGIVTFRAAPADLAAPGAARTGLAGAYASTVALTLANPSTILSFVAVFAGLGLAEAGGRADAAAMVAGVFLGSALWWLLLSGAVGLARGALTAGGLRWVNRLSGLCLVGFGLVALAGLVG
jgi:threonine/homoserine/homoserine lactone efflux protein